MGWCVACGLRGGRFWGVSCSSRHAAFCWPDLFSGVDLRAVLCCLIDCCCYCLQAGLVHRRTSLRYCHPCVAATWAGSMC